MYTVDKMLKNKNIETILPNWLLGRAALGSVISNYELWVGIKSCSLWFPIVQLPLMFQHTYFFLSIFGNQRIGIHRKYNHNGNNYIYTCKLWKSIDLNQRFNQVFWFTGLFCFKLTNSNHNKIMHRIIVFDVNCCLNDVSRRPPSHVGKFAFNKHWLFMATLWNIFVVLMLVLFINFILESQQMGQKNDRFIKYLEHFHIFLMH